MVYSKNNCIFWLVHIILNVNSFIYCFSNVVGNETEYHLTKEIPTDKEVHVTNEQTTQTSELSVEKMIAISKLRVKRQSGGGKYTDAAQMPQVKTMRLFLQMLKNLWAPVYVGGAHPLHHEVPKPIVYLFKDKLVEFFFPKVGDEARKD